MEKQDNNDLDISMYDHCDCIHEDEIMTGKRRLLPEKMSYEVADFFKVFGDSTRIKILYILLDKPLCVGDIAAILNLEQSAVSHQLRVLRQNKLVKATKEGKTVIYSLDDMHIEAVLNQGFEHVLHSYGRESF